MTSSAIPTTAVAERLGLTVRQVHYLVDTERLTPIIQGAGPRGPMFFDPTDVDAYIAARSTEAST